MARTVGSHCLNRDAHAKKAKPSQAKAQPKIKGDCLFSSSLRPQKFPLPDFPPCPTLTIHHTTICDRASTSRPVSPTGEHPDIHQEDRSTSMGLLCTTTPFNFPSPCVSLAPFSTSRVASTLDPVSRDSDFAALGWLLARGPP